MLSAHLRHVAAGDDSGFTLIELVVAMLISGVIAVVLLTFLRTTTTQTETLTEKVEATRTGRTTMTKVLDELHSACLASGSTGYYPVRAGSSATNLIFYNAYSKEAAIPSATESTSEGAYEHRLVLNETKHELIDTSYPSTSVSAWPVIGFSTTGTSRVLGEDLSETLTTESSPKAIPIFRYYRYASTGATSSTTTPLGTLALIKIGNEITGLTEAEAEEVAAVNVSFTASPTTLNQKLNRGVNLSSQVTFAFTAPSSESTIQDSPCE